MNEGLHDTTHMLLFTIKVVTYTPPVAYECYYSKLLPTMNNLIKVNLSRYLIPFHNSKINLVGIPYIFTLNSKQTCILLLVNFYTT